MLGLGLLGLHELGADGWRWLELDVGWSVAGGLVIGWLLGGLIARLELYLRHEHREAVGLDDFLALGLIGLSYGVALVLGAYGFLAVFAAGLVLWRIELEASGAAPPRELGELHETEDGESTATSPERAPAWLRASIVWGVTLVGITEGLSKFGLVTAPGLAIGRSCRAR